MIPHVSPKSPLFLTLSNLSKPCDELQNLINSPNSSRKERVEFEQNLWKRIKDTRELNEESLLTHFIGYYSKLLIQVSSKRSICDLLQYHILIRLGDLNRYINQLDVAAVYYCNARNLFPDYGHAYNQLALLTGASNLLKCCYYYARAAKSCERPLSNIADSNLRIAISQFECDLLAHILDSDTPIESLNLDLKEERQIRLPQTSSQWFYVMVIAIYSDNIKSIAKSFLNYMSDNFSTQKSTTISSCLSRETVIFCDRDSYLLLACLDILVDWLKLGSQGKKLLPILSGDLRRVRSCLHKTLTNIGSETTEIKGNSSTSWPSPCADPKSGDTTHSSSKMTNDTSSTLQDSSATTQINSNSFSKDSPIKSRGSVAFPHDFVLKGFEPLDAVHRQLNFSIKPTNPLKVRSSSFDSYTADQKFIESNHLSLLLTRISTKLQLIGTPAKKGSRNIALESILSNMTDAGPD